MIDERMDERIKMDKLRRDFPKIMNYLRV